MTITVVLPRALVPHARGAPTLALHGDHPTVRHLLDALAVEHPTLRDRLLTEQGALRPHVNVFVGEESVKYLDGLATSLRDGDTVVIAPAVSGG